MLSRLEIRPVVSRRLRAALVLVLLLGCVSLSQTSLITWQLALVAVVMGAVFIQAWRASGTVPTGMVLSFRPLSAEIISSTGSVASLTCTRLSVYPWLIVLHVKQEGQQHRVFVLLPDSLNNASPDQWRQLLIWSKLMRRKIAIS